MIKINRQSSNLKRFLHDFEKKKQHVDGGKLHIVGFYKRHITRHLMLRYKRLLNLPALRYKTHSGNGAVNSDWSRAVILCFASNTI